MDSAALRRRSVLFLILAAILWSTGGLLIKESTWEPLVIMVGRNVFSCTILLIYLRRFSINAVKIDGSFVRDAPRDANDAAIVRAVISLCQSLKLDVVAEGVETEEQLAFLGTHGCELVQGYLLGRPVPAEKIRALF